MELYKSLAVWSFDDGTKMALNNQVVDIKNPRTYIASRWDTLISLAFKYYGDARMWYIIAEANGIIDPYQDLHNLSLIIPDYGN